MGCSLKVHKVRCPICGKRAPWEGNPFRPFCSERCKLIDLGSWLDENYRISTSPEGVEEVHFPEEGKNEGD
ncbi:DNA gyrase inhibitor YacG [Thermosulfuriphilus sp.]